LPYNFIAMNTRMERG